MTMGKTRKKNKHLPRRMYMQHGAYWYVDRKNKWHRLGDEYGASLKRYAAHMEGSAKGTVGELITRYETEVLPERSEHTKKGRAKEFKSVRLIFNGAPPRSLKPSHVWDYFRKRGANQAALHEVRALSAVLSCAVKWGAIDVNPLLGIRWGEGPKFRPRDRYVTDDEFRAVHAVAQPMVRYAMEIGLITSMSQEDILDLERSQITADGIKIKRSKTEHRGNKAILYPVTPDLQETIDAALMVEPRVRRYVICNRAGHRYTMDGFQTQWKRAVTKAYPNKADRYMFRDLRAKSISEAESLEEGRKRAGHADGRITEKVYRRLPVRATIQDISHLRNAK